jgi:hypothetical protein
MGKSKKAKKVRADAKDLAAAKSRAIAGGKGTVNVSEVVVTKTTDVSSTSLSRG